MVHNYLQYTEVYILFKNQRLITLRQNASMIDASSSSEDDVDNGSLKNDSKVRKGSKLRSLLGLDQDLEGSEKEKSAGPEDDDSFFQHDDDEDSKEGALATEYTEDDEYGNDDLDKEVKFIPGMRSLEEKIRSTLNERKTLGDRNLDDLTPWEKYQLKRKEKKREKKLKSKELKESFKSETRGMEMKAQRGGEDVPSSTSAEPSSKAELDLLLAGDDGTLTFAEMIYMHFSFNPNCIFKINLYLFIF